MAQPWPRLNPPPRPPSPRLLARLRRRFLPPVPLKVDESIIQTRAPERESQSELSSVIAGPGSLDPGGFVPADLVKCRVRRGFVNRHTFCERRDVNKMKLLTAGAEGRG